MDKKQLHRQIQWVLLSGIALTLPFAVKLNHALIIAALAHAIVSGAFKETFRNITTDRLARIALLFFTLHLLSLLFSDNIREALAITERRLSLLIFPLLLLTSIPREAVRKVLLAFAGGNLLALSYCLLQAVPAFSITGDPSVFYYHKLSAALGLNAVYFSAYLVFSIHILLDEATRKKGLFRTCCIVAAVFFTGGCLLLSSKMMLFVLVLGLIARFVWTGNMLSARTKIISIALVIILPMFAIFTLPALKERIGKEIGTNMQVITLDEYKYDTPFTGTSLRLVIWRYCYEILGEHRDWLTGVGTGDFQDLLNERYRKTGIYTGGSRPGDTGYLGYGPHNQYIETVFSLGITGLIVFVTFLVLVWRTAIINKNNLLFQLVLLLTLFCLSESVLSTNKGIIFFFFFIFLLYAPVQQTAPEPDK